MLQPESTKYCRKRIEGYSEIVDHVPGSQSEIHNDIFRTKSKCISCKWLIVCLIIIIIIATGIAFILWQALQPNGILLHLKTEETDGSISKHRTTQSNGMDIYNSKLDHTDDTVAEFDPSSHKRKKRNACNETDDAELHFNSKLSEYYKKFCQKYADLKSAAEKFMSELQNYMPSLGRANNTSAGSSQQNENIEDMSLVLRTEPSFAASSQVDTFDRPRREPNERANPANDSLIVEATMNIVEANATERVFSTLNQTEVSTGVASSSADHTNIVEANATERVFSIHNQTNVSADVAPSSTDHTKGQSEFNAIEGTTLDSGILPSLNTQTIQPPANRTELENASKNDTLNGNVTSTTQSTISLVSTSEKVENVLRISAQERTISITPISEIESSYDPTTRDESTQQQRYSTQFHESGTTGNSVGNEPILSQVQTNHDEHLLPHTTAAREVHPSSWNTLDSTTSHIMKISHKNRPARAERTTAASPDMQTTIEYFDEGTLHESTPEESPQGERTDQPEPEPEPLVVIEYQQKFDVIFNETLKLMENANASVYLLKDFPEDAYLTDISRLIAEKMMQSRSSGDTDNSDPERHMLCYQKTIDTDGQSHFKFVKIPLNQSVADETSNYSYLGGASYLPPYSAHSLATHKNNTANQSGKNKTKPMGITFTLRSSKPENNTKNSEYDCTYSQARDADKPKQAWETVIKSLLTTNSYLWNAVQKTFCADDERMCNDGKRCIKTVLWCDEVIQCDDRSDEANCSCRERINVEKLCDGYFDCPDGADEQNCFDCPKNTFACNDFKQDENDRIKVTCIPMEKRCDGLADCPKHKDEQDCELLTDTVQQNDTILVSYFSGYLHRNWKGKWYPVCSDDRNELSVKACESELGLRDIRDASTQRKPTLPIAYKGQFVTMEEGQIIVVNQCAADGTSIWVDCPTDVCGSRVKSNDVGKYHEKRDITTKPEDDEYSKLRKSFDKVIFELGRMKNSRNRRSINETSQAENLLEEALQLHRRSRRWQNEEFRVVGGEISEPGAWPWIVAIYRDGVFHCGAMILDEYWLLSAAHCVEKYDGHYYEARAGILRRLSFSPMEQTRRIIQVIIHEGYTREDMKNDIALLRVSPALKLNRWVRPICLPETRFPWGPPPGQYCTAVGWGATREHGYDPDNMREVEVPILPTCKHRADIEGDEMCAGFAEGRRDTCQGDSGGPLLCRIPASLDHWYVAGIVSHGEGCARRMEPGVYTRIAIHIDWIMKNTDHLRFFDSQKPRLDCPGMKCSKENKCVSKRHICDKVMDCLYGDDELQCETKSAGRESNDIVEMKRLPMIPMINLFTGNSTNSTNSSDVNVSRNNWWITEFHDSNHEEKYFCKIIKQEIPKSWYCDGASDCEDGTDEIDCLCVDILKTMNSSLICDGTPNCYDWSDERNCAKKNCTKDEFTCYRSHTCVNTTQVCDGKSDCPDGEDEQHCLALSEYHNVKVDDFNIPAYREKGVIMENKNGTWKPYCFLEQVPDLAAKLNEICKKLGFKVQVEVKDAYIMGYSECKSGYKYLHCLNYAKDITILPWFANLYVNGSKTCNGLLLFDQWLVADYSCPSFNLQEDHLVAVLGGNKILEDKVKSPHEQIIRIDYQFDYVDQKAILLHLENMANTTEYVKPLQSSVQKNWISAILQNADCFMVANSKEHVVIPIISQETCFIDDDECSFKPSNKTDFCKIYYQNHTSSPLICLGTRRYWHLTAFTKKHFDGFCSGNATKFSVTKWNDPRTLPKQKDIDQLPAVDCSGHRCALGKCLLYSEICDGKADCRNKEDETSETCATKLTMSELGNKYCKTFEFKCKNNRCIDRNFICDGNDDCEDESDEPPQCSNFSCVTYLNMTSPSKLCDSHIDCWDKSDESSLVCPNHCNSTSHFKCPKSNQCIPLELVCDGESDCPLGDDENKCWELIHTEKNENKPNLFTRNRGEWHETCISQDFTAFRPEVVCKEWNLGSKTHKLKKIPGIAIPPNEYTKIVLLNKKVFSLTAKPVMQSNMTDACYYVHIKCD